MRAQLRTYHAIPSLQAHQDPNSYKQLQDAPRLKSILKGASEDRPEPNSLDKIKHRAVPRTNPVNLIFVLSQFASKVTELHIPPTHDFYDLIMRTNISSESRARAFLWLMWFYLESDFTEEGAEENPFGAGVDYGVDVRNQGVPKFEYLNFEQEDLENIDTREEIDYGHAKMRERKRIIEADQAAFQAEHGPPKRGPKPKLHLPPDDGSAPLIGRIRPKYEDGGASPATLLNRMRPKYESDMDSTRSTPPPLKNFGVGGMRIQSVLNKNRIKHQIAEGSSPVLHERLPGESTMRRPRPLTAHQLAVERNRNQRVDYILSRGLRKSHHLARKRRKQEGAFYRAMKRAKLATDPLGDSESEESYNKDPGLFRERGFIGLVQLDTEDDDFGEEISAYAAAFRRMGRRLDRWDARKGQNLGVMGTNRVAQTKFFDVNGNNTGRDNDETEDEKPPGGYDEPKHDPNGDVTMEDEEDLDEMEKELLGLGSGDDDEIEAEAEEDLDDVDKELLGLGGDETEEEGSDMEVD
jgi:Ino eighty subunit 1